VIRILSSYSLLIHCENRNQRNSSSLDIYTAETNISLSNLVDPTKLFLSTCMVVEPDCLHLEFSKHLVYNSFCWDHVYSAMALVFPFEKKSASGTKKCCHFKRSAHMVLLEHVAMNGKPLSISELKVNLITRRSFSTPELTRSRNGILPNNQGQWERDILLGSVPGVDGRFLVCTSPVVISDVSTIYLVKFRYMCCHSGTPWHIQQGSAVVSLPS
jgi:hypothetical protein